MGIRFDSSGLFGIGGFVPQAATTIARAITKIVLITGVPVVLVLVVTVLPGCMLPLGWFWVLVSLIRLTPEVPAGSSVVICSAAATSVAAMSVRAFGFTGA